MLPAETMIEPHTLAARLRPDGAKPDLRRKVESTEYGVSMGGDFEPLIDEATFYRVQAVLGGRILVARPRNQSRPLQINDSLRKQAS